ncbi:MAG: Ig-like domain-containing protein, partial [Pseudomonadota bacterium]
MTYKNYEFTAFSEAELDVGNVTCGTSFTMPSASVCISVSDNDAFLSGDSKKNEKATDKHGQHASITGDSGGDLGNGGKIYAEQYFWVCDNQGNWFVMVEIEQEGGGGDYFTFYNGGPWHAGTPEPGAELTVHSKCNVTNDYLLDYKCLGAGEKNEAPKAEADCIFVCEDEGGNDIDGNVLANDTDADGDALRVSGVDGRASNVGKWVDLDKGRVKISADGTIDFDADGDFDDLKLGETAEVVVKYDVSDGNGGNDWSMVTIKIEGKEPPIVTEPCTVQLLNHPDGAAAGPFYGLRLDNVFGEGIWTFDFEADGALMYATIDGSTIHIWGTAVGGRDTGSSYDDPALFAIDFTYDMVQQASGDDDLVVNAADQGQGAGTISRLDDDGSVVETKTLTDKAGSHPFSFRFGNEDDDDGHRGFEGKSGWGWLHVDGEDPAGAQDWLFTAGPKVMEPICVEENTSFVVDLDLEIDCPIKDIGVDLCAVKSKEGKPAELTLVYVRGDQIVQSTPDTKGKHDLDVLGADADGTVYIKVLSKKGATLFEGEVSEGESFSFDNGGKKLDSETTIKIYDRDGGDLLQKIDLHTSCSAPLAIGDIFGGVQLVGATTEKGTVFGTTGETLSEPNLVYSIAGGPDQDLFQVDPTTGAVSFTSPPDYENPQDVGRDNTYDVIVRATATVPGEEICIDFDDKKKGDKGSIIIDGVTFTAIRSQDNDGKFNDAMIFDANKPTGGDYDLKQPAQKKILIISEDGDKRDPDDNAKGGTIKAEFESPVTMTSIVLLDTEESGGSIEMFGVDGNLLATVAIPSIGNGDLQTIDLGDTEGVSVMQIHLEGSGAIDDVKFTRGGEEKYVEKAVRVEVKDVDEFGTITGRIFCDDDCDGLQNI